MVGKYIPFRRRAYRKIQFTKLYIRIDLLSNSHVVTLKTDDNEDIASAEYQLSIKGRTIHIDSFVVLDEYQGKGYGNFLARIIIDLAKLQHIKTITLIDHSTLEGFWQRLGFKSKKRWLNNLVLELC